MIICENCHALFFQKGLTGHIVSVDPKVCTICRETVKRTTQCDCELPLLNIMQLCRALFAHLMEIEARLQMEQQPSTAPVALWRPGGLN